MNRRRGVPLLKRILTALLAGFVLTLSGCSLIFPGTESSVSSTASSSADYSGEYESSWCYQRLDARLQNGYKEMYKAVREGMSRDENVTITDNSGSSQNYLGMKITLSQPLNSRVEAQTLYTAFVNDNPQFFYISNTYSYEGYRRGSIDFYNVFCLVFTMRAQERLVAANQLNTAVESFLKDVNYSQDQFEKELMMHDRLLQFCSYETRASATDNPIAVYPMAFTAYGALVEGRAVCEGYSRAMELLLHRCGLECTLVGGKDESGAPHMWDLVTVDGRNYHLDPTWDDNAEGFHHSYFNLTTEEILRTHTIDASTDGNNIGVDTCTAVDANYYYRLGQYLDTTSRNDIAAVIARCVKMGYTTIDLQFSKSTYANAHLFVNNRALLTEKVNALLKGTGITMWNYEEYNVNNSYCTLTLYKAKSTGTTAQAS